MMENQYASENGFNLVSGKIQGEYAIVGFNGKEGTKLTILDVHFFDWDGKCISQENRVGAIAVLIKNGYVEKSIPLPTSNCDKCKEMKLTIQTEKNYRYAASVSFNDGTISVCEGR